MIDAFANFSGGDSNNGVRVRIVVGLTLKDLNAEDPLFQLAGLALQDASDNKPEKLAIPLAGIK
jgi:hypothetical protein